MLHVPFTLQTPTRRDVLVASRHVGGVNWTLPYTAFVFVEPQV